MRVSQHFGLGRTQPSLSFVDVDTSGDVRLFISPRALRLLPSDWGAECVALIQSFFSQILKAIRDGDDDRAIRLLEELKEPNETHLGLSKGKSRGRGLGSGSAKAVWAAFTSSAAAKSGLLTDLEDTVLMIDGISVDIVSDVVTNIIRGPLIQFTQETCARYNIPMTEGVASGPIWDSQTKEWTELFVSLPIVDDEKLLLVPKEIVRMNMDYDVDKYYRHYILERLRQDELKANSSLVNILKTGKNKGKKKVYKTDLREKYGSGKKMIAQQTMDKPELLQQYKNDNKFRSEPLPHRTLSDVQGTKMPDWDGMLDAVTSLPPGKKHAYDYENAIEALLSALFYPVLAHPRTQTELHDGRKRIDITYSNMATQGFFLWLSKHYPAPHIFFECKNFGTEVANPELDQISGRFSPSRGQFGIIVCRQFSNRTKFDERCRDTAKDNRGYILTLDDADLVALVQDVKTNLDFLNLKTLKERFDKLVF